MAKSASSTSSCDRVKVVRSRRCFRGVAKGTRGGAKGQWWLRGPALEDANRPLAGPEPSHCKRKPGSSKRNSPGEAEPKRPQVGESSCVRFRAGLQSCPLPRLAEVKKGREIIVFLHTHKHTHTQHTPWLEGGEGVNKNTTWKTLSERIEGGEGVAGKKKKGQNSAQAIHIISTKVGADDCSLRAILLGRENSLS